MSRALTSLTSTSKEPCSNEDYASAIETIVLQVFLFNPAEKFTQHSEQVHQCFHLHPFHFTLQLPLYKFKLYRMALQKYRERSQKFTERDEILWKFSTSLSTANSNVLCGFSNRNSAMQIPLCILVLPRNYRDIVDSIKTA